jgi:Predicted permeases
MYALLKAVTIFFVLVIFMQVLKRQGVFNDSHQPIFNRLVTELALPFTIFATLAGSRFEPTQMLAAAVMFGSIIICSFAAYIISRALSLSWAKTGALVLLAGIGCTSTLAYPLIRQIFGTGSEAMTIGLIIGEFGVIIPTFTLGVPVAAWFGGKETKKACSFLPIIWTFFKSPIFISLVLGLLVSQIPAISSVMTGTFCSSLFSHFAEGLEILVAISLGLMLKPIQLRPILPLFLLIFILKLFVQPVIVLAGASILDLSSLSTNVLVIEAAMPSGAIAAVMADRYGCDGGLASALVIATSIVSLVTIPFVTFLLV